VKPVDLVKRVLGKLKTRTSVSSLLFWNAQLILVSAALLVVDQSVRLSILLAYLAVIFFVLTTKVKLEKAIFDESAIDQLRGELNSFRESASIISYLNSVMQPRIPIWYTKAYRDYSGSPEMLEELFNRMTEAKPKNVLELGSGLTTLVASYALRNNEYGKITSWDCLETRAAGNRELIRLHEQGKYVEIVDAKTSKSVENGVTKTWFDEKPEYKIDFLVVDESIEPPLAPSGEDVLESLREYLNIGCTIFIHDRIRSVDNPTLSKWLNSETELLLIHTVHTKTNTYSVLRFGPW
jgi:hypothetical protein